MKVMYHLGLGDAIACAAIIAKLAQENDIVEIPCWEHNLVSVSSFYINYPNVKVKPIQESDVLDWTNSSDLRLGVYGDELKPKENEDFVQWFYRQAGIDISEKYKYCPLIQATVKLKPYIRPVNIIYHDSKERGFNIKRKPKNAVTLFDGGYSILSNYFIIEGAKEIHCIDSSVLHLVECLPTKAKLFYHKYARPNSTDYKYLTKNWEVIE